MRHPSIALAFAGVLIAIAACGGEGSSARVPGYLATDPCSANADESSCVAEAGCEWSGACYTPDPCRDNRDLASCADAGCAWADVELCPAPGDNCAGGFCYTPGDDSCACVCPESCPPGEDCPACECDCSGGSGGTCTCECPPCPPGETCEPCGCDCAGTGCTDPGTCTCVCPECPRGEPCPPCDCTCDDGGGTTPPTETCECPPCLPGETCEPCTCTGDDPCLEHADETACLADTANECTWIAFGIPCTEGEPCVSGVCQGPSSGGDAGCACVCPDCPPGETCPPCECSGTGTGTVPPGG